MKKEFPHPLRVWLDRRRITLPVFAATHGIPFRTLYDQLEARGDPRLSTLLAIEKATKTVTLAKQAKWLTAKRA